MTRGAGIARPTTSPKNPHETLDNRPVVLI